MFAAEIQALQSNGSLFHVPMETLINPVDFKLFSLNLVGKPYRFGAKWDLNDKAPIGPIDCSGFSRWLLHQFGIEIPDGSGDQYDACELLNPQSLVRSGDLAFFIHPWGEVHHVGVVLDDKDMIEARGHQTDQQNHPIYNAVILRSRKIWETWHEFSGYMRPKNHDDTAKGEKI